MDRYLPELSERATRWLRFGLVLVALALLVWAAIALQQVLTPIVAAFAIAYILNPIVTWLETSRRVSRVLSVSIGLVLLVLLGLVLLFAGVVQLIEFAGNLPRYVADTQIWLDRTWAAMQAHVQSLTGAAALPGVPVVPPDSMPVATAPVLDAASQPAATQAATSQPRLLSARLASMVRDYGAAVAAFTIRGLSELLSNAFHWLSLIVLLPMYTFFILVNFNDITGTIRAHLPAAYRDGIVRVVSTIDSAISNFFRGRLMVSAGVGLCTAIGWTIVGVPYGFALGVLGGVLNLIPFMAVLVLPPALILTYLHAAQAGVPWAGPVLLVFAVYIAVQAIESFVLSPVIESRSNGLHPVTVVVALLIGSQIAGLLGMLLAIPVASTLKSLGALYLLPEIRRLAGLNDPKQPDAERPYRLEEIGESESSAEPATVATEPGNLPMKKDSK
jgi:predicted PurR-regulated permease PerM